jgi:hypothetical protein
MCRHRGRKVSDTFPNDGWGGRVYHVAADIVQ